MSVGRPARDAVSTRSETASLMEPSRVDGVKTRDRTGEEVRLLIKKFFEVLRPFDVDRFRGQVVGDERVFMGEERFISPIQRGLRDEIQAVGAQGVSHVPGLRGLFQS